MEASNLKEVQEIESPQIVSKRAAKKLVPPKAKAVQKKRKAKPKPLSRKASSGKAKSGKLVCRYCRSDDLSPSFIKRRDRRCRKCFSKRYGSASRAKKAKRGKK
jgi:hypothetical protein